ncbi:MAG TPA: hypothetical protein VFW96_12600 [Thermomicrobiales bacterium]|nr:hypothetical protein [Thermomicrobiales bacterium]
MAKIHTTDSTGQSTVAEGATSCETECAESAPPPAAAELAALRARLREVEAALGLPLRPGQPVQPDVPALRRRVAALERRAGIVPGLVPLPGCDEAATPARATTITAEPAGRGPAYRERGRAALAAAALLAALAWLLHPLPGGPGPFRAAEIAATAPAAGPGPWRGTCRAGGIDCLPDEDAAPGPAGSAAPHGWAGTCRAGGIDCLPDGDDLAGATPAAGP